MYQILYVVRASSLTLDSRLVVGLSSVQVREALDTNPDWAQARFVLGTALMLIGDQNGARGELARAVELEASRKRRSPT